MLKGLTALALVKMGILTPRVMTFGGLTAKGLTKLVATQQETLND
jgi:hypothetical protein